MWASKTACRRLGEMTEREKGHRTFERDNNDFLLSIPTPLLHLPKSIDKDTGINDNDISLFGICLLSIISSAVLPHEWTFLLLVLVLWMSICGCGDPDTTNGELTTLRIGGWL